MMLYIMFKDAA